MAYDLDRFLDAQEPLYDSARARIEALVPPGSQEGMCDSIRYQSLR